MKTLISLALLGSALIVSGCGREAGTHGNIAAYGEATLANFASQDAYNESNQRLRDLGRDFAARTQDTVTFAFDRANLDQTARQALDTQVAWLKENTDVKMTIIGHADLVGTERYNKGLGLRRARNVLAYLSRRGISRKRLEAIASRGETEPVVATQQRERRNRRTVTTVSGFARNYVGTGLDGVYAGRVFNQYQAGTGGTSSSGGIN